VAYKRVKPTYKDARSTKHILPIDFAVTSMTGTSGQAVSKLKFVLCTLLFWLVLKHIVNTKTIVQVNFTAHVHKQNVLRIVAPLPLPRPMRLCSEVRVKIFGNFNTWNYKS
jgi:hypothetical protein